MQTQVGALIEGVQQSADALRPASAIAIVVMLAATLAVALKREGRQSIIALWFAQLSAGAVLLDYGAEMLSLAFWVVSTLVCIVYFLHADLFEPTGPVQSSPLTAPSSKLAAGARLAFPAVISAAFGVAVWALFSQSQTWIPSQSLVGPVPSPAPFNEAPGSGADERFILVELLALFSLGAAVAAGVMTRARRSGHQGLES
ncbi:MAG: hypothetical protein ACK5QT_10070 [Oligoflexia bacterium]|jgi:hypothetical protein